MVFVLVRKLLRDLALATTVVVVLLFVFQLLWARITHRITSEILVAFNNLGVSVDTLRDVVFQGPGQIAQAIMGGEEIRIESAMDLTSVSYVHPVTLVLLSLWAVGRGASAIAGELEKGTMELLLAQPLRRGHVVLAHLLVQLAAIPCLCAAVLAGTWLGAWLTGATAAPQASLHVDPLRFAPGLLPMAAYLLAVCGLSMAISAHGRSRTYVWGLAMTLLAVQFLVNVVAQLWPAVAPLRYATIYHHFQPQGMILQAGLHRSEAWASLALLTAVGAAGFAWCWQVFRRRDLPAPL